MLNSKNSAGIRAIILLRKEKKQRLKLIGGLEAFKKFRGLYSKCKKNPSSAVSQPTGAKKVKSRTLCVIRESIWSKQRRAKKHIWMKGWVCSLWLLILLCLLAAPVCDEPGARWERGASFTPRPRDGNSHWGEDGEDIRGLPEELHLRWWLRMCIGRVCVGATRTQAWTGRTLIPKLLNLTIMKNTHLLFVSLLCLPVLSLNGYKRPNFSWQRIFYLFFLWKPASW